MCSPPAEDVRIQTLHLSIKCVISRGRRVSYFKAVKIIGRRNSWQLGCQSVIFHLPLSGCRPNECAYAICLGNIRVPSAAVPRHQANAGSSLQTLYDGRWPRNTCCPPGPATLPRCLYGTPLSSIILAPSFTRSIAATRVRRPLCHQRTPRPFLPSLLTPSWVR